jgi:TolB-like protein/DNA-binding winged helix-turn-helix (wHTH) protein
MVRFGLFELDLKAGQLSKNGAKIRLSQQPFQLLSVLLERPGEVLTREELRQRLWSSDVFVDFDHGLNKSIQKIRDALGDSADSPRYIETVPRVGYRFIAPVSGGVRSPELEPNVTIPQIMLDLPAARPAAAISGDHGGRWFLMAGCVASLALTVGWLIHPARMQPGEPIRSLAVLPLDNLSGDPSQDYFADGMTDELTTMLAKNSRLRIVSRTSVMQYKAAHRPLPEIARELGVDGILEGSVARSGDKVHMTIQLIQASSDTHVWAESYDREENDVVSLPSEAAQTIAKRLSSAVLQTTPVRYVSPEAHDAYLRGRYLWFLDKNDEAGPYFKRATELQPDYALGWTGVSMYYGVGAIEGVMRPEQSLAEQEASATRAVELDESLPEAHLAMGASIFMRKWDWARADQEVARAIELDPRYAEAYHFRSKIYTAINRNQEAIKAEKKAQELDPFARPFAMSFAYLSVRRCDDAISDARLKLVALPQDVFLHYMLFRAYHCKGAEMEAAEELEKLYLLNGNKTSAMSVRHAFEQGGYKAVVRWQVSDFKKKSLTHYVCPVGLAGLYAQLSDREQALSLLEQGYRLHSPPLLWIQNDPAFDFLHSDERYRSIIKRVGLPPAY